MILFEKLSTTLWIFWSNIFVFCIKNTDEIRKFLINRSFSDLIAECLNIQNNLFASWKLNTGYKMSLFERSLWILPKPILSTVSDLSVFWAKVQVQINTQKMFQNRYRLHFGNHQIKNPWYQEHQGIHLRGNIKNDRRTEQASGLPVEKDRWGNMFHNSP